MNRAFFLYRLPQRLFLPSIILVLSVLHLGSCRPAAREMATAWDTVTCAYFTMCTPVALHQDPYAEARQPQEVKQNLMACDYRTGQTPDGRFQVVTNVMAYKPGIVCSLAHAAEGAAQGMAHAESVTGFTFTQRDTTVMARPAVIQQCRWKEGRQERAARSLMAAEGPMLWQFIVIYAPGREAAADAERLLKSVRLTR
ncbi:MAG: hypothetical protein IKI72_04760 [Bacteroidales bacterium]|nr:hypothetical protein [Bacteroidales bacterium]